MVFHPGDILFVADYCPSPERFFHIAKLRKQHGAKIVALGWSTDPIFRPQYEPSEAASRTFEKYTAGLLAHADKILCFSAAARDGLQRYAGLVGASTGAAAIDIVTPGGDQYASSTGTLSANLRSVSARPYALCAAPVGVRENQELLCKVWRRWQEAGQGPSPDLVLANPAGSGGTVEFAQKIDLDPVLKDKIKIMPEATDRDIDWLHRQALFCVYPTLATGWSPYAAAAPGYAKNCLVSSGLKLDGPLVTPLDPDDLLAWLAAARSVAGADGGTSAPLGAGSSRDIWCDTWCDTVGEIIEKLPVADTPKVTPMAVSKAISKAEGGRLIFDATLTRKLVGGKTSGIQRVQRKLGIYCLEQDAVATRFCWFDDRQNRFNQMSRSDAERIFNGFPVPPGGIQSAFEFRRGDILAITDPIWRTERSQATVAAKRRHALKLLFLLHDLIPVARPQYLPSTEGVIGFERYALDMLRHGERIVSISQSTEADIEKFSTSLGLPVRADRLGRLTLGSDFIEGTALLPQPKLLGFKPFVLAVGTIEPRKNYELLYDVWRRLYAAHGEDIPTLVVAGAIGWGNAKEVAYKLTSDPAVGGKIKLVNDARDDDLCWLYSNCLFTVLPSEYEGWGLPVSESLAHGKYCVASSSTSLPEAGQGLLDHIDPLDLPAWVEEIGRLARDAAYREARHATIRREYRPVTWEDCGAQFVGHVLELSGSGD
ncbi:MAG: glycosyltransferase [Alphaproteobacteria bacterium]|nr:glycosyltransferase [Alphaproteobacteria bacterium]